MNNKHYSVIFLIRKQNPLFDHDRTGTDQTAYALTYNDEQQRGDGRVADNFDNLSYDNITCQLTGQTHEKQTSICLLQ